jgi:hypothetical protein
MPPISPRWAAGTNKLRSIELLGDEFPVPARIVSGLAMQATWARALRPSRLPISAKVPLSGSDNRKQEGRWARKIRSAAEY